MPESVVDQSLLDAFIPSVKQIVTPHVIRVPSGTSWFPLDYHRPVKLTPLTPGTVGTIYYYPGVANPPSDSAAIQDTAGAFLYAKGPWKIRTSSAVTEEFRVEDSGGAAMTASPPPTSAAPPVQNRSSWYVAQKTVAVPSTAEQCAAQAIPDGFALVVKANPNNTDNVGIGQTAAAADLVTGTPMILAPGESVRLFVTNANLIWVDAIVAAEGVCLSAEV